MAPNTSHPRRHRRPSPTGIAMPLLEDLASSLATNAPLDADGPPLLLALPDPHDPLDRPFEQFDLDGVDPATLRTQAPRSWWAGLALVASGWALVDDDATGVDHRSLFVDGPMPSAHPNRRRTRTVQALSRDGAVAVASALDGDEIRCASAPAGAAITTGSGPHMDAMRRMFRLPTAPPPIAPIEMWAAVWLSEALDHVTSHSAASIDWPQLARLHPGLRLLGHRSSDPLGPARHLDDAFGPRDLVPAGRALARHLDWTALRLQTASGEIDLGLVDPATAAWADDGMFARRCLLSVAPLWSLVRSLSSRCDVAVLAQLQATLCAWDVGYGPPGAPPSPARCDDGAAHPAGGAR